MEEPTHKPLLATFHVWEPSDDADERETQAKREVRVYGTRPLVSFRAHNAGGEVNGHELTDEEVAQGWYDADVAGYTAEQLDALERWEKQRKILAEARAIQRALLLEKDETEHSS
jgi:hypothetical protein